MVKSRLRGLERKLIFELAEQGVEHEVEQFLLKWDIAQCFGQPLPESLELIHRLLDEGFYLRGRTRAFSYLSDCRHEGTMPEKKQLLHILLPWTS